MKKKTLVLFGGGLALGVGLLSMGGNGGGGTAPIPNGAGALPQAKNRRIRRQTRKIVYHTTSRSFTERVMRQSGLDPMDPAFLAAAVDRYVRTGAAAYANALVVPSGASTWLAHPDRATLHTATPDNLRDRVAEPGWWRERWPGVRNAVDLIGLRPGEYINNITVSVDVVPLPDRGALTYTDASLDEAARIGRWLAETYGLSLDRADHLAHSDLDPWARGNAAGGWDPGWDWDDFMRRLAPAGRV